jgi:hypothetical protein
LNPAPPAKRASGRLVALILIILCLISFLATVSNYKKFNPLSTAATVQSPGNPAILHALFEPGANIQPGQRVLIRVPGADPERLAGTIVSIAADGTATIETTSPLDSPAGTPATASIEGTLPPQPQD